MPLSLAVSSTTYGAAFGLFPIGWIVFWAIVLYRVTVDTGKFEIIKDSVGGLTNDRRLQAMFIAFSFGAFIEGAAGFGAPVAVSGAMLAGLGFNPFYAAGICLLANTAPVAFGSIGIPVITLANVTGLPVMDLSSMVGRLCAMISIVIPGYLIVVMAGGKRALEVLPAILACGISFAGGGGHKTMKKALHLSEPARRFVSLAAASTGKGDSAHRTPSCSGGAPLPPRPDGSGALPGSHPALLLRLSSLTVHC